MSSSSGDNRTVYLRNVNYHSTVESLANGLSKFGEVESARIPQVRWRGQLYSRGFGFVTFKAAASYQNAVNSKEDLMVDGRKLFVAPARERVRRRSNGIFLPTVPQGTTQQMLMDLFKDYAPKEVRLPAPKDGRSPFAFIEFNSPDDQEKVMKSGRKFTLQGTELVLKDARPRASNPFRRRSYRRAPREQPNQ